MQATSGFGVWFLLGALWLASLPVRPLFDPDEGRYAEIPREMAASGDWVSPRLNGLKYFEKPPLQYWATAALYSMFGVHDWTARAWATTLAFLCIPLVFVFALRAGFARDAATVAAALLAINPYFAVTGQLNLLDQGFTLFLSVALFAFVLAQLAPPGSAAERNRMLITWAALALATLSKGIVAPLLAGGTVLIYMVANRDLAPLKRLHAASGLPLFLAIAVPWFWLIQSRNPEFAHFFFVREHFERFLTKVSEHVEPWWFFGPPLLIALLPVIWNVQQWKFTGARSRAASPEFQVENFLLIWCGVVVALFSFSQSKLVSYIMPVMPALAVLLARSTAAQPAAFRRAAITVIGLMLFVSAGLVVSGGNRAGAIQPAALAWAGAVAALVVAFVVWVRSRAFASGTGRWPALAAISIAGYQCLFMCYGAAFPDRSSAAIAAQVAARVSPQTALYSVSQYRHSFSFYLQRPMRVFDYTGELQFGLARADIGASQQDRRQFLLEWQRETDAIAVIDIKAYSALSAGGMPGRVIAQDSRSVIVSRT